MSFTARGSISGTLSINPSATTSDHTLTFPGSLPAQGQVLRASDGVGNLEWADSGNGIPGGSDTQVQYNNQGTFEGSSSLTFNSGTSTLTSTNMSTSQVTVGTSSFTDGLITGITNPTNNTDVSNKAYVDAVAQGLQWKESVRAATTENITLSGEQEVDTVLLLSGARCLVKNQNLPSQNGIYIVSSGSWTRSSDMQGGTNASGNSMLIEVGQLNGVSGWLCNNAKGNDVVGSDELVFIRFTGAGALSAGQAISIATNVINVVTDGITTEISSNKVSVKDGGISASKLAVGCVNTANIVNGAVTNAKLANSSLTVSAGDGLQTGGSVSLGSSVTLDVDGTVVRTAGNQNIAGVKNFTDTTQSLNASTGAVVVSGGLGVSGNVYTTGRIETNGAIQGTSLSDTVATLAGGALTGTTSIDCTSLSSTGAVSGTSLSDGTATLVGGEWTGVVGISASGSVLCGSLSDGTATLTTGVLSGLSAPTQDNHATNKAYVDSVSSGLNWRDPARVSTTTNITLSGLQTIDGVLVNEGDRVLVRSQTTGSENGVYVAGTGSWVRSSDFSSGSANKYAVLVTEGDVGAGAGFVVTAESPYTIGTSNLVFTQFSGNPTANAGAGLSKTGNTLSVVTDGTTTEISGNSIRVKDSGISASKLAVGCVNTANIVNGSVTNPKLANSSLTVSAGDGLQTGGLVYLGSSVTLDVDGTVVRTAGNQSIAGVKSFTDTTQSLNASTGAVVVGGGLGVSGNVYTTGRIETNGAIQGTSLSDTVATLSGGALSGATSIDCTSLTSTGAISGESLSDGTATLSLGSWVGLVGISASGVLTLSALPENRVLITGSGGQVVSDSALTWDGTYLSASKVETQEITRQNGNATALLFSNGTGNITVGPNATGTLQFGYGPMLKLTATTSTLQSALTVQGNFSRKLSIGVISTAQNVTYTAQQLFDGVIQRDCSGADRVDSLPSAVDIVTIIPDCVVGSSIEFIVENVSTLLKSVTITGGQGTTVVSQNISKGVSKRFVALVTSTTFGAEAVSVFVSSPKDRIMVQASFSNPVSGGNAISYASWGPISTAVVDSTALGVSGTITQLVCTYSSSTALGIDAGESQAFSLGTADDTLSTFTPFSGGINIIVWDSTYSGTYPSTSSGPISIPFGATDRLAIRSVETGTVVPVSSEVRCLMTIELD